ncbi:MAG TPA: cell envelope integrity protein CreD [Caulobacterales bacterium]|nr:cell envelope integrity protein CreD [Caulobacterales bacterium]
MSENPIASLIPRGSVGLKLLLVCLLVFAMGIPLLAVGLILHDRQIRAEQVTNEIGARAGGQQVVGGPMLVVPYDGSRTIVDAAGVEHVTPTHGNYVIFAKAGRAQAELAVSERRRGIYRAAVYQATTAFHAEFDPAQAAAHIDAAYRLNWAAARVVMFVRDSRAVSDAAEFRFGDGRTATAAPFADLSTANAQYRMAEDNGVQAFAAPLAFANGPQPFSVDTRLTVGGAQRFAFTAFAQNTTAQIKGNRRDASAQGYFQSVEPLQPGAHGFDAGWNVPLVAGGAEAADLGEGGLAGLTVRDMAIGFVAPDNLYVGVARAVSYGILFIGLVFLATLIFEAVSGKRAHPAQYILVGLTQCVFYLLLLSITEILGFDQAFAIAAAATILLLAYYAGASAREVSVGLTAFAGLSALYGAMYVLLTLEDFALLAGSLVAFIAIAATMIATRRIDWYGRASARAA